MHFNTCDDQPIGGGGCLGSLPLALINALYCTHIACSAARQRSESLVILEGFSSRKSYANFKTLTLRVAEEKLGFNPRSRAPNHPLRIVS